MSDPKQEQNETNTDTYMVKILSPGDLDLFVKTLAKLTGVLRQKIREFQEMSLGRMEVSTQFEGSVDRIKRVLLPSIPTKLYRLSDLLFDSIYLEKLESPQLQDAIKLVNELGSTIEQISFSIHTFTYGPNPFFSSHDSERGIRRLKRYRCQRVQSKITDLFFGLHGLFLFYVDLLPIRKHQTMTRKEAKRVFRELLNCIHSEERCEDELIQWFDRSQLWIAQEHWREMANGVGRLLDEVVKYSSLHKDIHLQPLREFIPILKLSRLFLNKISKKTSEQSHPVSTMDTHQLLNLIELTLPIPTKLSEFYAEIRTAYGPPHHIGLTELVHLATLFHNPLKILTNHLNYRGANPNSLHNAHATFIHWYADWQSHFSLAVRRFHISYKDIYSGVLV
ncbi:hypothetical protein PGTUg99_030424 [Puccinia graminis f. sp. tritici]|uniref:Uncharacterized protein n=1 Tax=Puccinia graminis f. sp. tritici TaxID=56615 RepID=A0A5B0LV17_PUCGR|nr:hypothetical protein PGTUg99_030424 [Puccinia graminis f. sp. tritici]